MCYSWSCSWQNKIQFKLETSGTTLSLDLTTITALSNPTKLPTFAIACDQIQIQPSRAEQATTTTMVVITQVIMTVITTPLPILILMMMMMGIMVVGLMEVGGVVILGV